MSAWHGNVETFAGLAKLLSQSRTWHTASCVLVKQQGCMEHANAVAEAGMLLS